VRLATLDLGGISEVDLEGSGLDSRIYVFHLNSRVSHFCLNATFPSKLCRIQCRCRVTTSIAWRV